MTESRSATIESVHYRLPTTAARRRTNGMTLVRDRIRLEILLAPLAVALVGVGALIAVSAIQATEYDRAAGAGAGVHRLLVR